MKPVLEIQNISKRFFIDHERMPYYSFRDRLTSIFDNPLPKEEFWALKDVSFNVMPGESVGIIGRNGAGKSTLLKVLSRITPPTNGKIISKGRIASLLEVGTGFHQELTGRENIFMNGAILGMRNAEIKERFEEIVDFSGVEKFLDTQLKHYSSGMQLRLAFAVAAHLEPEILIIDEVLAVGDAEFQRKCIGKMEDVSKNGRTILFVSHNLDAVETLCKKSLLFANGQLVDQDLSENLIRKYISKEEIGSFRPIKLSESVMLEEFSFDTKTIISGSPLQFSFKMRKLKTKNIQLTDLCLLFYNYKKQRVAIYDLRKTFGEFVHDNDGIFFKGRINHFNLIEGQYDIGLFYGVEAVKGDVYELVRIQVKNDNLSETLKPYDLQYRGFVELI